MGAHEVSAEEGVVSAAHRGVVGVGNGEGPVEGMCG